MTSDGNGLDQVAVGGFSAAADDYARARPAYARHAIGELKRQIGREPTLDVAAGTGILSGQLDRAGLEVVAVEPVAEMIAHLVRTLPRVRALAGTAETLPIRTASFGAVVVGEAFHWFDVPAALAEAARVLVPGGLLAMLWNRRDDAVDWVARYNEALLSESPLGRPYRHDRDWPDEVARSGAFEAGDCSTFENPRASSPSLLVDRAASTSFVAAAPPERRRRVLDRVEELARTHPDLAGRARFELPYRTELHLWRRR